MKKSILWLIACLLVFPLTIISCEESDGEAVNPYENWQERNQAFIDSIANVARTHPEEWKMIHNYKFSSVDFGSLGGATTNVNDYVYCKILKNGSGATPLFTDAVSVNYRGQLIPLLNGQTVVFDQSYRGELNPETAMPVTFEVSDLVVGWTSVLQEMKEGDRWELYIPNGLGYGSSGQSNIPAYSTLIFDLHLVEVK